jgi:hypothetical protein
MLVTLFIRSILSVAFRNGKKRRYFSLLKFLSKEIKRKFNFTFFDAMSSIFIKTYPFIIARYTKINRVRYLAVLKSQNEESAVKIVSA